MALGVGQRSNRMGMPHLNQNQPHLKMGLANRIAAPGKPPAVGGAKALTPPKSPALAAPQGIQGGVAPGGTMPTTQSQPTDPVKVAQTAVPAAPAPPSAPKDPFEIPAYTGAGPDPRDATYWKNVINLQFNDRTAYNKDLAEQSNADTNYAAALKTAILNRGQQEHEAGEAVIGSGHEASGGWFGRQQANRVRAYTEERAKASLTKEQEDAARTATRNALVEGYGIEAAGELGEAAARYAGNSENEGKTAEPGPVGGGGKASQNKASGKSKGSGKGKGSGNGGSGSNKGPSVQAAQVAANPVKEALKKAAKAKK